MVSVQAKRDLALSSSIINNFPRLQQSFFSNKFMSVLPNLKFLNAAMSKLVPKLFL